MTVTDLELPGVKLIEVRAPADDRGYFFEAYNRLRYQTAGIECDFVQDNVSFSRAGVLRGLHFQHPTGQDKLVQVLDGEILDVAVDIRQGSPTFGGWVSAVLSSENRCQLLIPVGFAHGFAVTGDHALVSYKCSAPYVPADEGTILWNDPDIGIDWRLAQPILSTKDQAGVSLGEMPMHRLPRY